MPPAPPPDATLLPRLQAREDAAFTVLYRFYYPMVERFVRRNNGTAADAADVFQETLLVLLDQVPRKDFTLTSSLKTYVFAVASNLWLKRLRSAGRLVRLEGMSADEAESDLTPLVVPALRVAPEPEQAAEVEHQSWLVSTALRRVTAGCLKLLRLLFFFAPARGEAVAWRALGYRNAHSLDNQKYKCLEQARDEHRSARAADSAD